jgi:hypothetical protein
MPLLYELKRGIKTGFPATSKPTYIYHHWYNRQMVTATGTECVPLVYTYLSNMIDTPIVMAATPVCHSSWYHCAICQQELRVVSPIDMGHASLVF